jgi:hypothetical protein
VSAYYILARQVAYRDLGADYDDRRHAVASLERQGYRVTLEPAAQRANSGPGASGESSGHFLSKAS